MNHPNYPVILDEEGWEAINFLVRTKQITTDELLDIARSQAASLVYA